MSRHEQPLEVAARPEHLVDHGERTGGTQLFLRIHGDRVVAQWPPGNTFDDPPRFAGQVESRANELVVTGAIGESWASMFWATAWVLPTAIFSAITVAGAILLVTGGGHDGAGALLFGGIGTLALVLMWRWQRRLRERGWAEDARRLSTGLTRYLSEGDGRRPVL